MLYTVRPLERIYAVPGTFDPKPKSNAKEAADKNDVQYREVMLPNGRIVTRREGEKYIIEKINSTDMQDYLNAEYFPGKSIKSEY